MLVSYDGKPSPDWGTRLNLNALLALLSTILRALLVVIISQIISQQKWGWYSHKRPLSDLQQFDSGSRGSVGAMLLIPTVILKDAVTLIAAIVLVVSFLVGPFVQQASRTTPCLVPAPDLVASLPYAHYVPRRGGLSLGIIGDGASITGDPGDPMPDTVVAILSSVTAPNSTDNQIRGNCSTGTCTFRKGDEEGSGSTYTVNDNFSTHSTVAMCDRCIDIASLVLRNYNATTREVTFALPNGINLTYDGNSRTFVIIRPSNDLRWLGELLTPELRAISRWAYVNTTFLTVDGKIKNSTEDVHATAAVCVLYPCVRTYTASIRNNQLLEKEVSSEIMELSSSVHRIVSIDWWGGMNTQDQYEAHYAAVKSTCQVGGQVYDVNLNATTTLPNATSLILYDYTDPHRTTYRNISAPESCIYRHDVRFVKAISRILNDDIFDGSCSRYKENLCVKASDNGSTTSSAGDLTSFGVRGVLEKLIEGERGFSNVTLWFTSFANAMTSRFRSQYGGAAFNASLPLYTVQDLPVGEVQGTAWQTETCVSAHRDWLALPICLTAITTLLMLWVIASNWRHRRTRPVWKDNLLPLLFYRHAIHSENSGDLLWRRDDNMTELEHKNHLMETSEMEKVSKETPVTFQWPTRKKLDDSLEEAETSAIALHDAGEFPTQRSSHEVDAESLLGSIHTQDHEARSNSRTY
jgi:hypothetical protein